MTSEDKGVQDNEQREGKLWLREHLIQRSPSPKQLKEDGAPCNRMTGQEYGTNQDQESYSYSKQTYLEKYTS